MKWNEIEKQLDEAYGDDKNHPVLQSTKALGKACYKDGFTEGETKGVITGYIGGALAATFGMILTVLWQSRK